MVVNFTVGAVVVADAAVKVVELDERLNLVAAFELATIAAATLAVATVATVATAIQRNLIGYFLRARSTCRPGKTASRENERGATQSSPAISSSVL
jgi:hypothetical protein